MKSTILTLSLALAAFLPARADLPRITTQTILAAEAEKVTATPEDLAATLRIPASNWGNPTYERRSAPGDDSTITSRWLSPGHPERSFTSQSISYRDKGYAQSVLKADENDARELTKGGADWSSKIHVGQQVLCLYGANNLELKIRVGTRVLGLDLRGVEVKSPQQAEALARRWVKRSLAAEQPSF